MKNIFLSCLVCLAFNSFAQSIGVRLYQNTDFFKTEKLERVTDVKTTLSHVNFNRFSIAVVLQTTKITHELELFIPEITKPVDRTQFPKTYTIRTGGPFNTEISSYSFRYEIRKNLVSKSHFNFNGGVALNPYYLLIEENPETTLVFYASNKYVGISFNLIPEIQYNFTDRFSLVVNVPINVFDFYKMKRHIDNPQIPVNQQTVEYNQTKFFDDVFTIRFGAVYFIKK